MMSFVALSYLVLVFSVKDITLFRGDFFMFSPNFGTVIFLLLTQNKCSVTMTVQ